MIQRGKTELVFLLEHPEVDILEQAIVEISWIYVPERRTSLDDDYGEPYDFTYDVEVIKMPEWATLNEIEEQIDQMSIFDIMNN
jgi:hypothetical protein